MKTTQAFRVLLSAVLCFAQVSASAQEAAGQKFNFFLPTGIKLSAQDPIVPPAVGKFRATTLTPQFKSEDFSEIGNILARANADNILPRDWSKKPPTLWIYLPNQEAYLKQKDVLAAEARRQFAAVYPDAKLKVQIRALDGDVSAKAAFKKVLARVRRAREFVGNDPAAQAKLDVVEQTAVEAYKETRSLFDITASTSRLIKDGAALSRAAIVFGVRGYQTLPQTVALGGAPLVTSFFLMAFDAAAEYFIVKHTQKLQRYFATPPFRTSSELANEVISTAQNIVLNMAVFNVGRSVIMQAIQHMATPITIAMPTGNTVYDIIKWTLVGSIIYVGFNKGYNRAIDKGWVTTSAIDVGLQVPGAGDAVTPILNTDDSLKWMRPYVFFPQWIFYAAVGVAGYVVKRKSDRIVAVDASITDLEKEIYPEQPSTIRTPYTIEGETEYQNVVSLKREQERRAKAKPGKGKCQSDLTVETDDGETKQVVHD